MWCDHVGSRGTLMTHLSWEEKGWAGGGLCRRKEQGPQDRGNGNNLDTCY